jgi:hypothetical protein
MTSSSPRPTDTPAQQQAARVSRRWPLVSGGMAVLLVAALGAIIAYGRLLSRSHSTWPSSASWWSTGPRSGRFRHS